MSPEFGSEQPVPGLLLKKRVPNRWTPGREAKLQASDRNVSDRNVTGIHTEMTDKEVLHVTLHYTL